MTTLSEAIEKAAELLPEGASISIDVEQDFAWVTANTGEEGITLDFDRDDLSLADQVLNAINALVEWYK